MLHKVKKIDKFIVTVLMILMMISVVAVYSATVSTPHLKGHYVKVLFFYAAGFTIAFLTALLNYRFIIKYASHMYALGVCLLIAVKFIGGTINNAQGWIRLGNLSFQPAELFKLLLILFLAALLDRLDKKQLHFWKDVVPICGFAAVPFALVMFQNDLGDALSYLVILVSMLWIGNMKAWHVCVSGVVVITLMVSGFKAYIHFHDEIKCFLVKNNRAHYIDRIDPWLLPQKASPTASWHTMNAKLAIAAGGISGKGFMKGSSVQSGRVPHTYSDSTFVLIAEEFGFIGSSVLLLLYFILIHRMILIALECKDRVGPYMIVGIVGMLLYQVFQNIGAFLGLVPLTGITLPFISYGGTSLLINMTSIGIVLSICVHGQMEEDERIPHLLHNSKTKAKQEVTGLTK